MCAYSGPDGAGNFAKFELQARALRADAGQRTARRDRLPPRRRRDPPERGSPVTRIIRWIVRRYG
ncbi:hypothetical protein [Nonomuraea sp. NPDC049784]|uniref:hypothetical protein n=1 Tax=Nonomuraea sp. NPDC049784 TaxID=3154361 RepID=UPI0033DEDF47